MEYYARPNESSHIALEDGIVPEEGYLRMDGPNPNSDYVALPLESDCTQGIWGFPILDLETEIAKAKVLLKQKRSYEEQLGPLITINEETIRFSVTMKTEMRLKEAIDTMTKLPDIFPVIENWEASDGVYITLTPKLAEQISTLMFAHASNTFTVEKLKLEQLEKVTTSKKFDKWSSEFDSGWGLSEDRYDAILNAF